MNEVNLRPGDFPLGSIESRAAVRAMLASRKANSGQGLTVCFIPAKDGQPDISPNAKCTCKPVATDQINYCYCFCKTTEGVWDSDR